MTVLFQPWETAQDRMEEAIARDQERLRDKRTTNLMAEFQEGFAAGWGMAVGDWFKDALDIKYTDRQVTKTISGPPEQKIKTTYSEWTQGACFAFAAGHVLHDTRLAHGEWATALQSLRFTIQIDSARAVTPARAVTQEFDHYPDQAEVDAWVESVDRDPYLVEIMEPKAGKHRARIITRRRPGEVHFTIYKPTHDRTRIVSAGTRTLTQDDFVRMLILGMED